MQTPDSVTVDKATINCDGGGAPLGHPKVYITLHNGHGECPYCGRRFVLREGARTGGHGH